MFINKVDLVSFGNIKDKNSTANVTKTSLKQSQKIKNGSSQNNNTENKKNLIKKAMLVAIFVFSFIFGALIERKISQDFQSKDDIIKSVRKEFEEMLKKEQEYLDQKTKQFVDSWEKFLKDLKSKTGGGDSPSGV